VAEEELEGDGMAEGEAVRSVVVLGRTVASEVVSSFAGSVRAGGSDWPAGASWGSKVMDNAIAAIAESTAVASAHAGTSTTISIRRRPPRVRSLRGSHKRTANAHRSTANTTNSAARCHQIIGTSYVTRALDTP
jgi:hypothetical protein